MAKRGMKNSSGRSKKVENESKLIRGRQAIIPNPYRESNVDGNQTQLSREDIPGCTDATAINYDSSATIDDGSCEYEQESGGVLLGNVSQAKEKVIDLILEFIITNHTVELQNYRRHVNPTTGQIEIVNNSDSSTVIYEKDYRETGFDFDLISNVDDYVTNCLTQTDVGVYNLNVITSTSWSFIPVENTCNGFDPYPGISFSGYTTSNGTLDGCDILPGQQDCNITIDGLVLNESVLSILSQFMTFSQIQTDVDGDLAEQVLDTSIYELLPGAQTRQEEIDNFFAMYSRLKGTPPTWSEDYNGDGVADHFTDEEIQDGANQQYAEGHDVVYSTNNQSGFITRLNDDATDTDNENKTMEWLRNDLDTFLRDIDTPLDPDTTDTRDEYVNNSGGYIKFRGLNQGIIIRSTEGDDIGIIGSDISSPKYLTDGFTITMWVRFLDKVSSGTLFNFGNPLKGGLTFDRSTAIPDSSAHGFRLETYVLNKDDVSPHTDYTTIGDLAAENSYNSNIFDNSNTARFVRLIVNDYGQIRDSHLGSAPYDVFQKLNTSIPMLDFSVTPETHYNTRLLNTTFIPEDFNEWYFICATFNPNIEEDVSHDNTNGALGDATTESSPDYWLNHITPPGENETTPYTSNSGYGNKCKVEIISRSDLLRARGFKV